MQDTELVLEDSFNRIENIFHNDSLQCNWENDHNGTSIQSFYYISTLFNMNAEYARKRIDNMKLAIDIVNQHGGINGISLVLLESDYDGSASKIADIYKSQIEKYPNILCFIGTDTTSEKDAVDEISAEYEIPIFSITPGAGEHSYKSIIHVYIIYFILNRCLQFLIKQ